jgi:MFS family permease
MFQDDFGWDPAKAGGVVIFVFVGNLVIKPATTPLLRHFGFRTVLIVSNVMAGLATAACALLQRSTPLLVIAVVLIVGGAFRSIGFSAYNTITFADVEDSAMARANTLASTLQQVASGLGIALGALALRLGQVIRGPLGHHGSTHFAFSLAFLGVAVLVVPAIVEAWALPRTAGAVIGGGVRSGGTTIRETG